MIGTMQSLGHLSIMGLFNSASNSSTPVQQRSLQQYSSKFHILQLGQSGAAVRKLQIDLVGLDCYHGLVDGYFGPATEKAVRRVQRNFGLPSTGKCDAATWSVLAFGLGS